MTYPDCFRLQKVILWASFKQLSPGLKFHLCWTRVVWVSVIVCFNSLKKFLICTSTQYFDLNDSKFTTHKSEQNWQKFS